MIRIIRRKIIQVQIILMDIGNKILE